MYIVLPDKGLYCGGGDGWGGCHDNQGLKHMCFLGDCIDLSK